MSVTEHVTHLAGKPVAPFEPRVPFDAAAFVPRLVLDWEAHVDGLGMGELLGELLRQPGSERLSGIVFGTWDFLSAIDSSIIVSSLVEARDKLPNLRALFLGDIVDTEQEIAWIAQSDLAPLLSTFASLEELRIRGSSGLAFGVPEGKKLAHARLRTLIIESSGLSRPVVDVLLGGDFPALEHLELWIGGGDDKPGAEPVVGVDAFEGLLAGGGFPALQTLALKNAAAADAIAKVVAGAPILERLKRLDLSLGTLSDEGAEALLGSPRVAQLDELDLRKSYLSPEIIKRFHALHPVIADIRGSRFGKEERRTSTTPPKKRDVEIDLPLARFRGRS